ncbi:NUDIX domain-containing protein [Amnibacterium kyonggiense]|uniref:ADP-ribose pyrophosphatase YjhB (NUDIX family) n=1 Tax=Amnibacterium kyonggiense TaxID=595671 RepID=A0A4R7FKW5_9MICO|nr:NUDIX domain-containing protein [Amnibacterium kyonggiense]TDS76997.1 ADP-ribose pyrophosphatase YjhB (NUDIX family) [Amnibacterium kyonggiense]
MTDLPPGPPPGPRDPADGWVELPDGRRFWGRAGAAGLLVVAPDGAVLLQHRVGWSHFGGTWGLPGGARHVGESALAGALRETNEETGIEVAALRPRFAVRLDLDVWSYTTVAADAPSALPVAVTDRESTALEWVPADRVADRDLHPGFGAAWPRLQEALREPARVLVVDVANVMGSRPDGWWKDRAGAAGRLLASLSVLAVVGIPEESGPGPLPVVRRWPRVVAVLEGAARAAADEDGLVVVRAAGSGDDEVVAQAEAAAGAPVTVVTADRGLAERVRAVGSDVLGPGRLLDLL